MRKVWVFVVACGVALGGVGVWSLTRAEAKDKPVRDKGVKKDKGGTVAAPVDPAPFHHAIRLLREARHKAATAHPGHKFGGHRKNAVKDMDRAIHQLEEAIKYAEKHHKK
jgi:hypothetical protein